jgi:D-alanyl-D-alanine carboxypeptidase/D-alanyl-D-alanine-endopeptidase (penicillin-binding protein 4)
LPAARRNPRLALGSAVAALAFVFPALSGAQETAPIVVPTNGGEPWSAADVTRLASDLDAMLANDVALRGAHAGVLVADAASGAVLYARNADDEFQPASTLKLLVGSVALERLGPAYRFRTRLEALDSEPRATAPHAPALLLRAGGDPLLAQSDLDDAAAAVAAAGFTHVRDAFIDDSHDDAMPYAPGWTWDDFAYDYAAHVSAMTFEENVAHLTVSPGTIVGGPAIVRAAAPVRVRSSSEGCGAGREDANDVVARVRTGASGSQSSVDVRLNESECLEAVGSIPHGGEAESVDAAVPDPLAYARDALSLALRKHGVTVDEAPGSATASDAGLRLTGRAGHLVWQHDSPPLNTWLGPRFWIPSDNLFAELLLKELGFVATRGSGADDTGIAVETAWLQSLGLDPATVTLADGSGLSQYDRITPRDLVAVLQHDWAGPNRQLVLDSLPVGGARGTIEGIAQTPAAGRVFAKTGSMRHVRGLAGYLATRRHGAAIFAFSVDDWNGAYPALAALRARALARIVTD